MAPPASRPALRPATFPGKGAGRGAEALRGGGRALAPESRARCGAEEPPPPPAMEHITTPKVENVKLLDRYTHRKPANGTLYLTATHLIYVDASAEVRKETWILHHHIATVEKLPLTPSGCPLLIRCKNFRVAHFVIGHERDCHEVYTSLLKLSQPEERKKPVSFPAEFWQSSSKAKFWRLKYS
ncbi:UNVERIFIED_CONTAM: Myotubularin- protein 8 [Gekko kuhli]